MANTSRAFGLRPVGTIGAGPYTGRVKAYRTNAVGGGAAGGTAIGIGSIVCLNGVADDTEDGLACVELLATGYITGSDTTQGFTGARSIPVGVVVGVIPSTAVGASLDLPIYRATSTARTVLVCDDPMAIFEVQEDSAGGNLARASVGLNSALLADTPSTTTGLSNQELDTSSVGTAYSLPVQIVGFARRIDNEVSSSYAKVLVRFNKHAYLPVPTVTGVTGI
jgi:hypothetical protein